MDMKVIAQLQKQLDEIERDILRQYGGKDSFRKAALEYFSNAAPTQDEAQAKDTEP